MTWEGESLPKLQAPLLRRFIAYLLLHRETPQLRTRLAALFWPDAPEGQSRRNLRQLLYRLRRQLPQADRFLDARRKTVQWRADGPFVVDVDRFETAVQEADTIAELETAVSLYKGLLLPGHHETWMAAEREQLHQQFVSALYRLVGALEEKGQHRRAIVYARELVELERTRESSYRLLMRLHIANGDRAAALRVYDECVAMLAEEMGVAPSPALEELRQQLQALRLSSEPAS